MRGIVYAPRKDGGRPSSSEFGRFCSALVRVRNEKDRGGNHPVDFGRVQGSGTSTRNFAIRSGRGLPFGLRENRGRAPVIAGREFTADLLPRFRLEFVLFDEDLEATLQRLPELVQPERIAGISTGSKRTISMTNWHLNWSPSDQGISEPDVTPTPQIIGFRPKIKMVNTTKITTAGLARYAVDYGNND
jgi:hypothetical protein